ncbi:MULTISPECIES: pentaheme c-type cytochrome TorC [unclassified Vibrio]|uniref:pentaheme c-type cytochrome TorC n=1 Tax=unclassified Vibrio TaxID=2614977 RepID=UPI001360E861|nr:MULTISPECIES: pentaheme c-type cytochrome TorC [unclassified Vibrio]NAW56139.1 pentaheme c-type cytochrome TorC [Vibrio sp. V36_P2S2PM302]NAX26949.1 pentaheme c-type cytochrome TorC [Vibrio sp. V38_P2S17PM301]NAX32793.1 pentaheme c-type cytochrome TorC [Vibrio sp. V37_P2S8PM304]
MKAFIVKFWHTLTRPAVHISLGVLTMGGFVAGVIFWGGFNTALEATNTEEFCISCHTMRDNVYVELQETVHWKNHSGVRATCPDCHVPHNWTDKIARKMQASKEVFAQVFGNYGEEGVFEEHRIELAKHEWDRFSANKSLECKNCHNYDSMDFEQMSPTARIQMKQAAEKDQSCLDCHKGIAHNLPKNMDSAAGIVGELEALASNTDYAKGATLISVRHLPVYEDANATVEAGLLNPASAITVVDTKGEMVAVEISGWRKAKGFGRVIQEDFGMNIATASLLKDAALSDAVVTKGEKKVDELTGLPWEQVTAKVWMKKQAMLNDITPVWEKAGAAYKTNCSVCHTQPKEDHFDANTWPGMFDGMLAFVNFDTDTEALVLKYLQKHSSDFSEGHH